MTRTLFRHTLLTAMALTFAVGAWQTGRAAGDGSPARKHGPITWTDSLDRAQKTAAKEKKVVFVDFYAEWCGPCQEMLHTTYRDRQVVAQSRKFVPVLINVDKQPKLAEKYGVEAIPTVVFLDARGKVLRKETGYHEAREFLKMTNEVLKQVSSRKG
jgi:thiol:disulfide interchange protein